MSQSPILLGPITVILLFWAVSPNLPTGLSIDSSGTISGTPTDISPTQVYMITATNSGGQSSTNITLTVVESPPSDLVYNPDDMIFTVNSVITTVTPTYNGGTPTTWTHTELLPTGLSFDSTTGSISGTPTTLLSRAQYTITATNSGGSATVDINITVNDVAPSISYSLNDITATLGVQSIHTPAQPMPVVLGQVGRSLRQIPVQHSTSIMEMVSLAAHQNSPFKNRIYHLCEQFGWLISGLCQCDNQ